VEIEDLPDRSIVELRTELVEVPPWAPLTKVAGILRRTHAYEVFVVSDTNTGMISVRDILRAKYAHSRKASSLAVHIPRLAAYSSRTSSSLEVA
jgi:hypothetical protein